MSTTQGERNLECLAKYKISKAHGPRWVVVSAWQQTQVNASAGATQLYDRSVLPDVFLKFGYRYPRIITGHNRNTLG